MQELWKCGLSKLSGVVLDESLLNINYQINKKLKNIIGHCMKNVVFNQQIVKSKLKADVKCGPIEIQEVLKIIRKTSIKLVSGPDKIECN